MSPSRRIVGFSRRAVFRALWLCGALAAGALGAAPAAAQQVSPADKELARRLMDEADKAFEAKRYPESVQKYCQADKIMGVPTTALECGKALEAMLKLLDAKDVYVRAAHYEHPAGQKEPEAFVNARAAAVQKADALGPRIPELVIAVDGVEAGTAVVIKVDGEPLRADIPRRLVNPAPHEHLVSASAPGYREASVTVTASESEQKPVALHLEKGEGVAVLPPPPPPPIGPNIPLPPPQPDKKGGGANVAAAIGFGVGAAALITGGVTGAMSLSQTSSLKSDCGGDLAVCDTKKVPDAQSRYDKALALANASNATLVIGGVGVVFGVIALFAFKPSEPKPEPAKATIVPLIGPGSLGLRGAF